jgi:hypothetical protein
MAMAYSSGFNSEKLMQNLFARQGRMNKEMREAAELGAELIMEKSKSNSPVDTHNLEEAHHIEKSFTTADHVRFTIVVSGPGFGSDRPRDVGGYAVLAHEQWPNMHPSGGGSPGKKSLAKMAAGHEVGAKFLERALETEKEKAVALIRQVVRRNWSK